MQDFWITRSASWKPSFFTWQLWGLDALPLKTHKKLLVIVPKLNCSIKLLSESDILNCDTATVCDLLKFPDPQISTMLSRSARAETRQSRKEDIKRVMHSVDKVIFQGQKIQQIKWTHYFVTGTPLGKAMDTDSRHYNEAIQVDASVPTDQIKD